MEGVMLSGISHSYILVNAIDCRSRLKNGRVHSLYVSCIGNYLSFRVYIAKLHFGYPRNTPVNTPFIIGVFLAIEVKKPFFFCILQNNS